MYTRESYRHEDKTRWYVAEHGHCVYEALDKRDASAMLEQVKRQAAAVQRRNNH